MTEYEGFDNAPSKSDLSELSQLASDLYRAELELQEAEETYKAAQRRVRDISEHQIPELMDEIGMAEFTTTSGIKISVKDSLRVSPPAARRQECWDWIEEQGYGDLVKRNVIVGFGRNEDSDALALRDKLEAEGLAVKDERKVESATLKKFIKERLEAGDNVPLDMFGTVEYRQTKITQRPGSVFGE